MKNILVLIPLILVMQGCQNETKEQPELKVPTPSDIAVLATKNLFKLNIDVQEHTKEKDSKVKNFSTKYQDNICDVDVDSETLMVVNMTCKTVKTPQDELVDKTFNPAGKQAYQKAIQELPKE